MSSINRLPLSYKAPEPTIPETKWCPSCKQDVSGEDFAVNYRYPDGLNWRCKPCTRLYAKAKYHEHKHKRPWLERHLRLTYGITIAEYDVLLEVQNNVCAVCHGPQTGKSWHVDHDHKTGAVRGILCQGCNIMIGGARDRPEILIAASEYLRKRSK